MPAPLMGGELTLKTSESGRRPRNLFLRSHTAGNPAVREQHYDNARSGNSTSSSPDDHVISDRTRFVFRRRQRKRPNLSDYTVDPSAAYEKKTSWKSTAYSATKVAIYVVKESSDVFPALKTVAGVLFTILNHCDVWFIPLIPPAHGAYYDSQQTVACRQTIMSLIPRVEGLAQSLSEPAPEGEVKEEERRKVLKR